MKVKTSYTRKWFLKAEVNYLLVFRLQDRSLLESSSSYFTVVRVTTEVSGPRGSAIFLTLSSRRVEICATTVLRHSVGIWYIFLSVTLILHEIQFGNFKEPKKPRNSSIYMEFANVKVEITNSI